MTTEIDKTPFERHENLNYEMIIRMLQNLFGKTVPNEQQEPTITPPVENSAKESDSEPSADDKLASDIEILMKRYGNLEGLTIEIQLQKLLTIVPRKRERADAYKGLVSRLKKDYNCNLIINSRKKKKIYETNYLSR